MVMPANHFVLKILAEIVHTYGILKIGHILDWPTMNEDKQKWGLSYLHYKRSTV